MAVALTLLFTVIVSLLKYKLVEAQDEDLENFFLSLQDCITQIETADTDNPRYRVSTRPLGGARANCFCNFFGSNQFTVLCNVDRNASKSPGMSLGIPSGFKEQDHKPQCGFMHFVPARALTSPKFWWMARVYDHKGTYQSFSHTHQLDSKFLMSIPDNHYLWLYINILRITTITFVAQCSFLKF